MGISVVTAQDFERYCEGVEERLRAIESELEMYRQVLPQWITRSEAMEFLGVGSTKLNELRRTKKIVTSNSVGYTKYYIPSLRDYMISQSTDLESINKNLKIIFQKRLQ